MALMAGSASAPQFTGFGRFLMSARTDSATIIQPTPSSSVPVDAAGGVRRRFLGAPLRWGRAPIPSGRCSTAQASRKNAQEVRRWMKRPPPLRSRFSYSVRPTPSQSHVSSCLLGQAGFPKRIPPLGRLGKERSSLLSHPSFLCTVVRICQSSSFGR